MQLGQEADKVLKAATEPINRPGHHHVELALSGIPAKPIELGALISALSATDAVILINPDDLTAHVIGDLTKLALLIGRRLIHCRDPKVKNRALHASDSKVLIYGRPQSQFPGELFTTPAPALLRRNWVWHPISRQVASIFLAARYGFPAASLAVACKYLLTGTANLGAIGLQASQDTEHVIWIGL